MMVRRFIAYALPAITTIWSAQTVARRWKLRAAQLKDGPTLLRKTMVLEKFRM